MARPGSSKPSSALSGSTSDLRKMKTQERTTMTTVTNDKALRDHLLYLLKGDGAHSDFEVAIKDLPATLRGKRPKGAAHSPWEVLANLRITHRDILESTRKANHVSPDFPAGYWPST